MMKFVILGSAAAERFPALWCECEICSAARKNGGRDIRRTVAYLIDSDTLVDFGPDLHWQVTEFGIDLTKIRQVVITHPHGDHLSALEFLWRKSDWFSHITHSVSVIAPQAVLDRIADFNRADDAFAGLDREFSLEKDLNLIPVPVTHAGRVACNGLSIFPMDANHAREKQAVIYLIAREEKTILIANDTGWPFERTWNALAGKKIDLAVIDSTFGFLKPDMECSHMGVHKVVQFADKLRSMGCLKPGARLIANHFSHNGGGSQKEFEAFFSPFGIECAYDGMTVDL